MADNQVTLSASPRPERGKGAARRLRAQGRTPAVVYGREVDSTPVSVDALELYHALHTPAGLNALIRLQVDGDEHLTIAREVQKDPVKGNIVHVDLLAVSRDQKIQVEVPIHLLNERETASSSGGVVNLVLHTLPIRVSPLEVPNYLELDVEGMTIGDTRRAEDIALPAEAELAIEPERTIVTVNPPDIVVEPEAAAEEEALEELAELTEEELELLQEAAAEAEEAPEDATEAERATE